MLKKQSRRLKLNKEKDGLEITPGDSVLVIGKDGNIKKLVVPDMNRNMPHTLGTERLLEILKLFDPNANFEMFENIEKRKLN